MRIVSLMVSFLLLVFLHSCNDKCEKECQNEGIVTIDCTCHCEDGFTGENCETATCTLACQNNGTLTTDCACDCPAGWTGLSCETCVPRTNLSEQQTIYTSSDGNEYNSHVWISLPERYVLTGFGFTTNETLMLQGRELNQDGTFGPTSEFRAGSQPNGSLAASYSAPDGYLITGIGWGETQGSYRLVINYNQVLFDDACDMYLGPELLYDNGSSTPVDVWRKISNSGFNTQTHALSGAGLVYNIFSEKQIKTEVIKLINF